jgi:hypothetical protein
MKRYQITISGSRSIVRNSDTLAGVLRCIKCAQGNVVVDDTRTNREIACGTAIQVIGTISFLDNPYAD